MMNWQELLKNLDTLVFSQTGQHLDSLQMSILQGVLENQKYAQIAQKCHCTVGHVKDEAYELWQKLSESLGENINKSNLRATIERNVITNSTFTVHGNPIGSINLCPNSSQSSSLEALEKKNNLTGEEGINTVIVESLQKQAKLEVIPNLARLGLTSEQIAESLGLSVDDVNPFILK